MVYTLSYSNIHESEEKIVGKHALFLGRVARKNLVPCVFFVVTGSAFSSFFEFNSLKNKVKALDKSSEDLFWSSLKDLFSNSKFPDEVIKEFRESYDALSISGSAAAGNLLKSFDARVNVFVSSSQANELKGVFLNIKGFDNLLSAIKSSWFSFVKSVGVNFLDNSSIFNVGVIVEKFVSGEVSVEVEVSSNSSNLLVSVYKGLPEISFGIVKDVYVLSFNHLEFITYELNHQNFSILHQEESGVLLKKRLGKEGADDKASKHLVSECARLGKRVFDVVRESVKVIFVVKKDVPYLFFVDSLNDITDNDVVHDDSVVESLSDESFQGVEEESVVTEDVYGLDAKQEDHPFSESFDKKVVESVVEEPSVSDVEDSFVDADEFIVQGEKTMDDDDVYSSFFKLVELLEEDISKSYVESFGFSPPSIEEAIFELDTKHGFDNKNKILRVFEFKSLIMEGEEVSEDILSSLCGVIEDFLNKEGGE